MTVSLLNYGLFLFNSSCVWWQEAEIQHLETSIMEIENGIGAVTPDTMNPEVERLLMENGKLKYQITHLKRVCDIAVQYQSFQFM